MTRFARTYSRLQENSVSGSCTYSTSRQPIQWSHRSTGKNFAYLSGSTWTCPQLSSPTSINSSPDCSNFSGSRGTRPPTGLSRTAGSWTAQWHGRIARSQSTKISRTSEPEPRSSSARERPPRRRLCAPARWVSRLKLTSMPMGTSFSASRRSMRQSQRLRRT